MISIGRGIRWYKNYKDEVDFCIKNNFDFMQLWFKDGDILVNNIPAPKEEFIKSIGFPIILHAVFDPEDFDTYGDKLLELVDYFGNNEVIVHPVSEKSPVNKDTEIKLAKQVINFSKKVYERGITWYLENNSVIDKFHYRKEELEYAGRIILEIDGTDEEIINSKQIIDEATMNLK